MTTSDRRRAQFFTAVICLLACAGTSIAHAPHLLPNNFDLNDRDHVLARRGDADRRHLSHFDRQPLGTHAVTVEATE